MSESAQSYGYSAYAPPPILQPQHFCKPLAMTPVSVVPSSCPAGPPLCTLAKGVEVRYTPSGAVSIPPPPPGCAPNAAQPAAMQGLPVLLQKKKRSFFRIWAMFPIPLKSMNDQQRHDYILKNFVLNQSMSTDRRKVHDIDVIKEHHRFLWDGPDTAAEADSWEVRLARRYYDKLFKEYCIADLTCYKLNKVALRWRTEAEVVTGKGQFQCGSRRCERRDGLRSWEVNFAYQERGERKNALVKLRLCAEHSEQLNYTSRKREIKRMKRAERQAKDKKSNRRKDTKKPMVTDHSDQEVSQETDTGSGDAGLLQDEQAKKATAETVEQEHSNAADDVWCRQPEMELEQNSRETDFERYLEDLLL